MHQEKTVLAHTKEIKSKQTFRHGAKTVEYNLIQSKKRKTCEVMVDKEQITIRAPLGKPLVEIKQTLNGKMKWVSKKQKELQIEMQVLHPGLL